MSDTERDFFRWKETYSCIESETLNFFLLLSRSLSIEAAACLGKLWPQFEEKESSHAASLEKERDFGRGLRPLLFLLLLLVRKSILPRQLQLLGQLHRVWHSRSLPSCLRVGKSSLVRSSDGDGMRFHGESPRMTQRIEHYLIRMYAQVEFTQFLF